MLPQALDDALLQVGARGQYHAIVVDKGQDFERGWLALLYVMLTDPAHDVLYAFDDPDQSLYQRDVVAELGLPEYNVNWNCRDPALIHALAARTPSRWARRRCSGLRVGRRKSSRRRRDATLSRRYGRCSIG